MPLHRRILLALASQARRDGTRLAAVGALALTTASWIGWSANTLLPADDRLITGSITPAVPDLPLTVVVPLSLALGASAAALLLGHRKPAPPLPHDDELLTHHDANGRTLFASTNALALTGHDAEDLCGDGLFSLIHVQDRVAFRTAVEDAKTARSTARCSVRLMGSDTIRLDMRLRAGTGSEPAVVATSRDTSVGQREADALELARREADELSRAKSRFIAVASHELRTPLNAIIGFSDLLRSLDREGAELPLARRGEYAGLIHGAGEHLLAIVNDLLDMSRIEAGRYELCLDDVDFGATVSRCVAMLAPIAAERDVTIADVTDRNLPSIEADPRACRQLVINLLSNAIKFAPEGSTVTVSAARRADTVVLGVADRGEGMSDADIERLGQPFTQVGTSKEGHDRAAEGTGLGLSIVKGLVELHGGSFQVRSIRAPRAGHGTDATITLPLRCAPPIDRPRVVELPTRQAPERTEGPHNRSNEYGRVSA